MAEEPRYSPGMVDDAGADGSADVPPVALGAIEVAVGGLVMAGPVATQPARVSSVIITDTLRTGSSWASTGRTEVVRAESDEFLRKRSAKGLASKDPTSGRN